MIFKVLGFFKGLACYFNPIKDIVWLYVVKGRRKWNALLLQYVFSEVFLNV